MPDFLHSLSYRAEARLQPCLSPKTFESIAHGKLHAGYVRCMPKNLLLLQSANFHGSASSIALLCFKFTRRRCSCRSESLWTLCTLGPAETLQMSSLKALLEQKRKAVEQSYGSRKTLKTTALDTAQLSQVREQERTEREKKVSAEAAQLLTLRLLLRL